MSSLTGHNLLGGRVGVSLISLFSYDAEIRGFQLSADRSVPNLTSVELLKPLDTYNVIWSGDTSLPTGYTDLNSGSASERTIRALGVGETTLTFDGFLPLGLTTFTLTVDFTNNSRSSFSFTVVGP